MTEKKAVIIGGGVAGLSAALELAGLGVGVEVVEQSAFPGGHAVTYACKATDRCVKCGACIVEEKLARAIAHPNIKIRTGTRVQEQSKSHRFSLTLAAQPVYIDAQKCNNCGECFKACPEGGAVVRGFSRSHAPFYAISQENCRYVKDRSCTLCSDACPHLAIDLAAVGTRSTTDADAVVLATGFTPFHPVDKPYGYGVFDNVVTHLEMERMIRDHGRARRPSDGADANRVAFVQCVGSRDAKLGHLWCSRVCCGSALRMAGIVKARRPETEITFFYMDVQTFGRDFDTFFSAIREDVRMIRSIPGDVYPAENQTLRVTYWDNTAGDTLQEDFDLVVLSVGMVPGDGLTALSQLFGVALDQTGFVASSGPVSRAMETGVFTAGTVAGPMTIAETVASAEKSAWDALKFMGIREPGKYIQSASQSGDPLCRNKH